MCVALGLTATMLLTYYILEATNSINSLLVEEQKYLPIASTPAAPSVAVFIYPPHLLVIVLECPWGDTVSSLKVMFKARRTDVTHFLRSLFIYLPTGTPKKDDRRCICHSVISVWFSGVI